MRSAQDNGGAKGGQPPPAANFGLSGVLAAETNTVNGVEAKYNEPPEAAVPSVRWRLYVFKDQEPLEKDHVLHVHRQSAFLFGRERRLADVPTDHPSCSKQHAVLQYRKVQREGEDGMPESVVRPYLVDLGSTNGTTLNGQRLEPLQYYELLETDVVRFGSSTREYVLMNPDTVAE